MRSFARPIPLSSPSKKFQSPHLLVGLWNALPNATPGAQPRPEATQAA
jgi:hypothetical protein